MMKDQEDAFLSLLTALDALGGDNPALVAARAGIEAGIDRWVADALAARPDRAILRRLLLKIRPERLDAVLTGHRQGGLAAWYDACRPFVRDMTIDTSRLSTAALDRLIADGYPHEDRIRDTTGEKSCLEWLTRGSAYGEAAFRAIFPRRSPVTAYWSANGLVLPKHGLCRDGIHLVATECRTLAEKGFPVAILDAARAQSHSTDWRLIVVLGMLGANLPPQVAMAKKAILGRENAGRLTRLLHPAKSNHAELLRRRSLGALPSVEAVLGMERGSRAMSAFFADAIPASAAA